jgi:hypothetical protein
MFMNKRTGAQPDAKSNDIDRLWNYFTHEDDLLATRVSVFLLAQSILIAVSASLVNNLAEHSRSSNLALQPEIFGLTVALIIAGIGLTLIFWYVFSLNYDNIGITMELLRADPLYMKIAHMQSKKRQSRWYFRILFRRRGMNWAIINGLSVGLIFLWGAMGVFLLIGFLSS